MSANNKRSALDNLAIKNFQDYIRIRSVHPNIDYTPCIEFLQNQAKSLNLPIAVYQVHPSKPIAVITLAGSDPNLPSILLNSHMDVVPVFEDKWTHKPFEAFIDEKENIYGRGTQDMKSVGSQYLETIRRILENKITLKRTVHLSFVPDEEIGGAKGMELFAKSDEFKKLNVGFALDEGLASPNEVFSIFYGERFGWRMRIHCTGHPGHGSLLLENTAGEKASKVLNSFYEFRNQQIQKLKDNPELTIGDVTTVNLTQIEGGVQSNVIPAELILTFDCRLPITVDAIKWETTLNQWCKEAGDGVWIEFIQKRPPTPVTILDESNKFWLAFKAVIDETGMKIKKEIFTGATDSRHLREMGIPVIGFSPMHNTPILLHDNDEFLNANIFLRGIEIYYKLIQSIANV